MTGKNQVVRPLDVAQQEQSRERISWWKLDDALRAFDREIERLLERNRVRRQVAWSMSRKGRRVLALALQRQQGLSPMEVAQRLGLSESTVRQYLREVD